MPSTSTDCGLTFNLSKDTTPMVNSPQGSVPGKDFQQEPTVFHVLPRELRDQVYRISIFAYRRSIPYDHCYDYRYGRFNPRTYMACQEVVTFKNLLLALNATPRLRYEVCETFYHKNKFRVELGHLRKFLGSASPLVAYTIGWDVAAWIRSIKVGIWWKRGKRPGQLAYELRAMTACPDLRHVTVKLQELDSMIDNEKAGPSMSSIAKVCKELQQKLGSGFKLLQYKESPLWIDITWILEAPDGTGPTRDALRATFAEAALTEDIYFPKVDE